jgi:hypothetical protein
MVRGDKVRPGLRCRGAARDVGIGMARHGEASAGVGVSGWG